VVSRKLPPWWLPRRVRRRPGPSLRQTWTPKTRPLMFAPVDVLMAYPTGLLTGPCDRSRVGIGVTYAAGGASLTGIIYRERLTTISSRNVSQRHCVTGFIQNLGNLICRLTEIMVFLISKIRLISNTG
jgi:hypothetical protein